MMGRPKLADGARTKKIDVRFTENEYQLIERLETQLGISKTELVRFRTLKDGEKMLMDAKGLISALDSIGAEMNRIGNNINQLARHANTLNLNGELSPVVIGQFNKLFSEYLGAQRDLQQAFRQIMRSSGK